MKWARKTQTQQNDFGNLISFRGNMRAVLFGTTVRLATCEESLLILPFVQDVALDEKLDLEAMDRVMLFQKRKLNQLAGH